MHTIELRNGSRLAYRDHGKGPVMLLVHGWGVSGELFEPQLSGLSDRFRVIAPDLPGHGASSEFPPDEPFGFLADAVFELIQKLGLQSVCLVGWSMGAMVAWDLLDRFPHSGVSSLVTIDMVPKILNDELWRFGLRDGQDYHAFDREIGMALTDWDAYIDLLAPQIVNPEEEKLRHEMLRKIKDSSANNHPPSMVTIWTKLVEQDFRAKLQNINIPTLVISGGQSALYSVAASEWVAGQISAARFEVFERSGHAPQLDDPQRFNQLLADFVLKSFEPTASARTGNQAT